MNKLKYVFIAAFALPALFFGGYLAYSYIESEEALKEAKRIADGKDFLKELEKKAQNGEKEKADAKNDQKNQEQNDDGQPPDDGQKKSVSVTISGIDQENGIIRVRSFIPEHLEEGTCKITFRKNSRSLTKEAPAYPDASSTICTNPEIKKSEFPELGKWTVVVFYESKSAAGQSNQQTIDLN